MTIDMDFKAGICFLPCERPDDLEPESRRLGDRFPNRHIKMGLTSIIKWMGKQGYTEDDYDYYDIDTLLPTDEALTQYLQRERPSIV